MHSIGINGPGQVHHGSL